MNLSRLWPLLLGSGITLGLGAPIAKVAAHDGVGALAFALWPTLAAGLLLGVIGLVRQGRPSDPASPEFASAASPACSATRCRCPQCSGCPRTPAPASHPCPRHCRRCSRCCSRCCSVSSSLRRRGVAVGLGLFGALRCSPAAAAPFEATPALLAMALAIPASVGATNIYRSRRMPPGASSEWMSSITLLASSSMLALAGLALGNIAPPLTAPAIAWLALQTGVLTIGYIFYFALQRRAEPVTFSFIGYVMMIPGVMIGTFVFGERLPWTVWPAAALVFAALLLLRVACAYPHARCCPSPPGVSALWAYSRSAAPRRRGTMRTALCRSSASVSRTTSIRITRVSARYWRSTRTARAAGTGFPMHLHNDLEIVMLPHSGAGRASR